MKKILLSLGTIVFVGSIAAAATGAFFNDTETSTGNTFAAGDIDLKIDNHSYALDFNIPDFQDPVGNLVENAAGTWDLKDLVPGEDHFFDFTDLKPGDMGEDTISIHVGSNDAWMCAAARITSDEDNDITDPEDEVDGLADGLDGTADGDLDSALNFAFWNDDGDNVLEDDETVFLEGTLADMNTAGQIALADSNGGAFGSEPIPGNGTVYIGKAWCFGTLTQTPVEAGEGIDPTVNPGVTCNGAAEGNIAQTDSVQGDMQFYAVQARNNSEFTCSQDYSPNWPNLVD